LVYVTCSLLPEENTEQIAHFLAEQADFALVPIAEIWDATAGELPQSSDGRTDSLLLTPDRHGTDGFFIAVLTRKA
jgi:16S rRNA (cytosine967-C5)-methyltransferase